MTTLYHGSHRGPDWQIHNGVCLTDRESVAEAYAGRQNIWEVEIDLDSLNVEHVDGYDRDTNDAPADSEAYRAAKVAEGVDVLIYGDEDGRGVAHDCIRLISDRAVAAAKVMEVA